MFHKHPKTVRESATIEEVVQLLSSNRISSVIVVDDTDTVTGVISITDIVKDIVPEEFRENAEVAAAMYKHNFFKEAAEDVGTKTAKDVMRREFMTASPDAHIMEVAADFLKNDLYVVPIIDKGKLAGVITRTEIIRAVSDALKLNVDK